MNNNLLRQARSWGRNTKFTEKGSIVCDDVHTFVYFTLLSSSIVSLDMVPSATDCICTPLTHNMNW